MEAAGVALGIVPLFFSCLQYFELFKTIQSTTFDSQIILLKLDFEHERFIIWGEKHGIQKVSQDGRNPDLDDSVRELWIKNALGVIETLFKNGQKLRDVYGITPANTVNTPIQDQIKPKFLSHQALARFISSTRPQGAGPTTEKKPGLTSRTKWAVHDKTKFENLVKNIRDLVNGLYETLPISDKDRDTVAVKDIASLLPDIGRIRQVEEASEEVYPAWSEAARIIILASDAGSTPELGRREPDYRPESKGPLALQKREGNSTRESLLGLKYILTGSYRC
jgi:hypothetical protein